MAKIKKTVWNIWHHIKRTKKRIGKERRNRLYQKHVGVLHDPDILEQKIANVREMSAAKGNRKKFYVISWPDGAAAGLCATVSLHYCGVAYAVATGRIPVIDMQNHLSLYMQKDKLGKVNAWEQYFEQPFSLGLNSMKGGNVKKSGGPGKGYDLPWLLTDDMPHFDICFETMKTIYRSCFKLNETARKHIDDEYKKIIKPGMRVIGVNCRGADYNPAMAAGHPVQPDIDMLIAKVEDVMDEWGCGYIFLATPEKKSFDIFNSRFPGRVLRNESAFYDEDNIDFTKHSISAVKHDRDDDAYLNGLEYLTTIMILSRCTSAVLGMTFGSMVARYINDGKYENTYIFKLGMYPK